jgi:hypothetical protein
MSSKHLILLRRYQNDRTGVYVLGVEVSNPEASNQVLDFRFLRLAQYLRKRVQCEMAGSDAESQVLQRCKTSHSDIEHRLVQH